jgi:hypothetical protein
LAILLLLLQPFFLSTGEISPKSEIKNLEKRSDFGGIQSPEIIEQFIFYNRHI